MNFTISVHPNATFPNATFPNFTFQLPSPDGASPSPSNTLSAGSAAFMVIALVFGCMTQLPGSLVTGEANRFWRISPFLCVVETNAILLRMVRPVFHSICTLVRRHLVPERSSWHLDATERQSRVSLKIQAYALLAERLGNSRKYNYWLRQQWRESAPTVEQIVALLDEVTNLERGSTLRPIVIIPMLLQFAKVVIVDAGWIEVKMLPWIYFWSWFSVEFLLLMVHGDGLSEMDMLEAERILLLSVAPTEVVKPGKKRANQPAPSQRQAGTPLVQVTPPPLPADAPTDPTGSAAITLTSLTPPVAEDADITNANPNSVDLERGPSVPSGPSRKANVSAQSEALLASVVGPGNVPRNRITFRGGRMKLSTMQGNSSVSFQEMMYGGMMIFFEALYAMVFILIAWGDYIPTWIQVFLYIFSFLMFPLMKFDELVGAVIAAVGDWWTGEEWERPVSGARDWTAFRTMVLILLYYTTMYSDSGTVKPDWLDWLG